MPDRDGIFHGHEIKKIGSHMSYDSVRIFTADGTEYRLSGQNLMRALDAVDFKLERKHKYEHLVPIGQYAFRVYDMKNKVVDEYLEHPAYARHLEDGGSEVQKHWVYADGATDKCEFVVYSVGLEDYQVMHMCAKKQGKNCVRDEAGGMLVSMPAKERA